MLADLKKYCPDCLKMRDEINPIVTKRLSTDLLILLCNECLFSELCLGILATKEEVVSYGLPAEILKYLPLVLEDIQPILLLALHLHLSSYKRRYSSDPHDLAYAVAVINASIHNDDSAARLGNVSAQKIPDVEAETYEEMRLAVAQEYESSEAPYMKEAVLGAFAKIKHFRFPGDVIAHHLSKA